MTDPITRLDELRLDDPGKSLDGALEMLRQGVAAEDLPRLYAVAGSAYRKMGFNGRAASALGLAMRAAQQSCPQLIGDIYQRLVYVLLADGDLDGATQAAERAIREHVRRADYEGIGESSFEAGLVHQLAGRHDAALAEYRAAAQFLPASNVRYGFSLHLNRAQCFQQLGDQAAGLRSLQDAAALSDRVGRNLQIKLEWLLASALVKSERPADAVRRLEALLQMLATSQAYLDLALASLDLIQCLLVVGEQDRAIETARSMARYLQPLRKEAPVVESVHSVIVASLEGSLRPVLVASARAAIVRRSEGLEAWVADGIGVSQELGSDHFLG